MRGDSTFYVTLRSFLIHRELVNITIKGSSQERPDPLINFLLEKARFLPVIHEPVLFACGHGQSE